MNEQDNLNTTMVVILQVYITYKSMLQVGPLMIGNFSSPVSVMRDVPSLTAGEGKGRYTLSKLLKYYTKSVF